MRDADFVHNIEVKFSPACDVDVAARVVDATIIPALTRLGFDDNSLWRWKLTGLDPATEAKVMAAFEAEAKAIEAEARVPSSEPPQAKKPRRPRLDHVIKRAEQATGKPVQSVTVLPDGIKLDFGSELADENNPWPTTTDLRKRK